MLLVLIFRPLGPSAEERQAQLLRSREQYETTLQSVKQIRDLQAKLQGAIQNDEHFSREHFLHRETAFSAMVSDLENLASQNHLRAANVNYELKADKKHAEVVNVGVTMAVEGQYNDLVQFINKLEQSQLFWIVDNITVSGSANKGLRLNLQMETYATTS